MYGRNGAGSQTGTANSSTLISPLQQSHTRITSHQHAQSIPQFRKANLRDIRKSQRQSQQQASKDTKKIFDPEHTSSSQINPLTSVELNSHFNKRNQGSSAPKQPSLIQGGLQKSSNVTTGIP